MLYILKFRIPTEAGNAAIRDLEFGKKMHKLLADIKAESAYFTTINGLRGGYIILNLDETSQIPAIAEPFFLWLHAEVTFMPAMRPEDLGKAGKSIEAAVKAWG